MNEYKIEKNIKQPPMARAKYPFDSLRVGESFAAPYEKHISIRSRVSSLNHGTKKFRAAKDENGMIRVWRTE